MKIAVISDTHNNLANIKKVINWLNKEKINLLLHCGDINSQETIDEIKNDFNGKTRFVCGNADVDISGLEKVEEIKDKKIAFTHFPDKAKELAMSGKYNLVFYGHTHRPWEEKVSVRAGKGECKLVNPGEAAGQFYKPTFAIYDTVSEKLEFKVLEKLARQ